MCTYLEGNANLTSRIKDVKSWCAQREVRGLNMSERFAAGVVVTYPPCSSMLVPTERMAVMA
jgi:hypothetical protein